MRKWIMAGLATGLLAPGLFALLPQAAHADARIYTVPQTYDAPSVIYDRAEGLFYRVPPYYYSRYYGLDPYAWHYRNAGRYGQPYRHVWQYEPRPHIRYVPPNAAVYHRMPDASVETRRPGEPPTGSVPSTPMPEPGKPQQQKVPDIDL